MESSFKNILCTRPEVRNYHLPFPGHHRGEQGVEAGPSLQLSLYGLSSLQVHKRLRLLFVFLFCFVLFCSVSSWGVGRRLMVVFWGLVRFGFALFSLEGLLLFMGSSDPPKGEWI